MFIPVKKSLHFNDATKGQFKVVPFKKVPLESWFRIAGNWLWKRDEIAGETLSGFTMIMLPNICVGLNLRYFTDPNF